ncbi:MAG: hypothetical protein O3B72_10680 [Proteobacteria bacterium]|nr:hypothetical protein [Pseudomonadota bacterium]
MHKDDMAGGMLAAWQQCSAKPVCDVPLDPAVAYGLQQQYVALRQSVVAGYKAAVTNRQGQEALGLDEPLLGVLFEETRLAAGDLDRIEGAVTPVIETEVGFVLAHDVSTPVTPGSVTGVLACWQPMIEIGDIGFQSRPGVGDLIAGNAAGAWFLPGTASHAVVTANQATVMLSRDGETVHRVPATDALGDQFACAAWMINKALATGYELKAGMVLMTGALGAPVPAAAGHWLADYGEFGSIKFVLGESSED